MREGYRGHVRLVDGDHELGHVRVDLVLWPHDRRASWGGRVLGSDYLVWGANHRRVQLRFDDGSTAIAVVRAGGALVGQGDPPDPLRPAPQE